MSWPHPESLRYAITDGSGDAAAQILRLHDSVDYFQIREPHLTARQLAAITSEVLQRAHRRVRVLVNDRADVAVVCRAQGVHLRGNSISPSVMKRAVAADFIFSVSCHSTDDVQRAEQEGADLALLAPVFETPGKGPPLGLTELARAARSVGIPVLALGGVTSANAARCLEAGAAGIAGIRLFRGAAPFF